MVPPSRCDVGLLLLQQLLVGRRPQARPVKPVRVSGGAAAFERPGEVRLDVEVVPLRRGDDPEEDPPAVPALWALGEERRIE
jgi:hypothetical protein